MRGTLAGRSNPDDRRSLGDIVEDFMQRKGLTLQAMAELSGLSIASIAALRTGTRGKRPHSGTLVKLASAMETSAEDLAKTLDATVADRWREQDIVRRFRNLSESDKRQVERLLSSLGSAQ